jgi:acetyl esterase
VLHLHGGGWVVGSPAQHDWFCGELAGRLGATVLSVDYRKAPEHPAPAASRDAVAAARWLLDGPGADEFDGPVLVAGDSAGGNLAALVAIAARDEGWTRLVGQLLVYPATDLTMTSRSATTQTTEPILHRSDMEAFVGMYLAGGVAPTDPEVSPLHVADVRGVAPACVQTAARDPLRDEGRAYAEHLAAAGVPTRLTEYVDVPHGFVSLPGLSGAASQAVAELVAFCRPLVADGDDGGAPSRAASGLGAAP